MSLTDSHPHKHLFDHIATGDETAFTELFHIYNPKLLPFIIKLTRNEHLARELIQETFLRLWIDREELTKINNPGAWIYRIASNLSINWLKSQGNRRRLIQKVEFTETADSLSEELDTKELEGIIQKAINLLPERRQQVYRLSREQGLTHQQIAEIMQISPSTVKNAMGHCLKFIQEYIQRETGLSMITLLILFSR